MATDFNPQQHEQKTDVQEFVDDVRRFWDRFGMVVLLAVLAVLLVMLFNRYLSGREQRQREEAYTALGEAASPFAIDDVADRYSYVPGFAGYARLHAADLRFREAMGLIPAALGGASNLSDQDKQKGLEQAAELYQRVIDANASSLQVLNARLGLASVRETQGRFDDARKLYEQVVSDAAGQWPLLAERAKVRLADLDRIAEAVSFPPPKPGDAPAEAQTLVPGELPQIKLEEIVPGLKPEAKPEPAPEPQE